MKTKFNRILSSLLVAVMMFATVSAFIPVSAGAAYSSDVTSTAKYTEDDIQAIVKGTLEYDFQTAEEMLLYELCDTAVSFDRNGDGIAEVTYKKQKDAKVDLTGNWLNSVSSADGSYTIYANNYTGYIYYKNNRTGQIITSNPYNVKTLSLGVSKYQLVSQIELAFASANGIGNSEISYNSYEWAGLFAQISTARISNGLRVNYTLGDTSTRFLLPGAITAKAFDQYIAMPLIEAYTELLNEYTGESYDFFAANSGYTAYAPGGILNLKGYSEDKSTMSDKKHKGFIDFLDDTLYDAEMIVSKAEYKELYDLAYEIDDFIIRYNLSNPVLEMASIETFKKFLKYPDQADGAQTLIDSRQQILDDMYAKNPITKDDPETDEYDPTPVYVWDEAKYNSPSEKRQCSKKIVVKYASDFNFSVMYEEEERCSYENKITRSPVFRCTIEYKFDTDGSISITLPANSIIFDETAYSLMSITPLKYFGAGDMATCNEGGYIFYPDGSGTIVDFKDFYAAGINIQLQSDIFGQDYCYSKVSGAHREQITMPVYGIVSAVKAGATTKNAVQAAPEYVENGFFAIIEEGASLAKLGIAHIGDYASVYTSYAPYSLDFIEPETLSVSGVTGYTKVTESKYNGSYVTKIVMLTDPELDSVIPATETYYPSTYVGMATCYRDYLKGKGVLKALAEAEGGLSLYIEVLGAIEVTEKFLTFPVSVSKQLTTFEQVELMYRELSDVQVTFAAKSDEYKLLAEAIVDEETDENRKLKAKYNEYSAMYAELAESMTSITNINFKLKGFSNGGLTATYPVKLKWENACGGKKGFKELVAAAKEINAVAGKNFGIYPDFDFMYVNNTALFDGIGIKKTVSRMVDNRYASKQEYNAVTGVYDILNSMVVSPDNLTGLLDKFLDKYSSYDWKYVSVSTLGSDLNSNFDEDNPINRDTASKYVEQTLAKLGEYKVMLDRGNVYTLAYADHVIDATIDSSHFRYSSYTVPFFGLVLHSYVNYTGGAFNYTGSPKYDLLRAIENGSNLYYILCYENTSYLKEDPVLNKYYGIDYKNWYDSIVKTYTELNGLIGGLQNHEIVDHKILIAERDIKEAEYKSNMNQLITELLGFVRLQTQAAVDAKFDELRESNPNGYESVKVSFDKAAIKELARKTLFVDTTSELDALGFDGLFDEIVNRVFEREYPEIAEENQAEVHIDSFVYNYNDETCPLCGGALNAENKCTKVNALGKSACENNDGRVVYEYRSAYAYVTGSSADAKDYRHTKYTTDNGNVVIVTYQRTVNGVTETTRFILNYNTYDVDVRLGDEVYPVSKYGYYQINE